MTTGKLNAALDAFEEVAGRPAGRAEREALVAGIDEPAPTGASIAELREKAAKRTKDLGRVYGRRS